MFSFHQRQLYFIPVITAFTIITMVTMIQAMPLVLGGPEQQQQVIRSPSSSFSSDVSISSSQAAAAAASLLNQILSHDSDEDAYFGYSSWVAEEADHDNDDDDQELEDDEDEDSMDYGFIFNLFENDRTEEEDDKTEALTHHPHHGDAPSITILDKIDCDKNINNNQDDEKDKEEQHRALLMVSSSDIDDNVIEMAILARTRELFQSRQKQRHHRIITSVISTASTDNDDYEDNVDFWSDT